MLHNSNKTVDRNSGVDLYSDRVFASTPEFLDLEVLLQPLKEQFNLPTILIKVGNLQGRQFHCIGQEHKLSLLLIIIESYEPQMFRIVFLTFIDGQFYLSISEYSLGQSAPPRDALILQIVFGSDNKERFHTMYAIQLLKVVVAAVEDVVSACLNEDFLLRL